MNVYESMLTVLTSLAIIAAIGSAIYAGEQARTAKRQADHAAAQAEHAQTQARHAGAQAEFAEVQAKHAGVQARIAKDTYDLAEIVHRDQNQPYVFADIRAHEHEPSMVVLIVHNVGPTVATNVQAVCTPAINLDPQMPHVKLISEISISALAPGGRLVRALGFGDRFFSVNGDVVRFTVTATGPHGPAEPSTYDVDVAALATTLAARTPVQVASKAIVEMAEHVRQIAENAKMGQPDRQESVTESPWSCGEDRAAPDVSSHTTTRPDATNGPLD